METIKMNNAKKKEVKEKAIVAGLILTMSLCLQPWAWADRPQPPTQRPVQPASTTRPATRQQVQPPQAKMPSRPVPLQGLNVTRERIQGEERNQALREVVKFVFDQLKNHHDQWVRNLSEWVGELPREFELRNFRVTRGNSAGVAIATFTFDAGQGEVTARVRIERDRTFIVESMSNLAIRGRR